MGRTFDLKHAYRQFGVDRYHHSLLWIAVKKPGATHEFFNVGVLTFGAVGSVSAFSRISSSLSYIETVGLSTVWIAFFDDFTAVGISHLSCRILWLQALVQSGMVHLSAVAGSLNPADVGTRRMPAARLRSLMAILGLYNMHLGCLEGSDDPGRIFSHRQHNVVAVLSALGLSQMQGCQDSEQRDSQHENSAWVMFATGFLGLATFLFCSWISGRHFLRADQLEPDAEPDSSGHVADTASQVMRLLHCYSYDCSNCGPTSTD
eukprot:s396_g16.t1